MKRRRPFTASCLNRTIRVHPLADIAELPARLVRSVPICKRLAWRSRRRVYRRWPRQLGRLGVTRLCALGRMPWPTLTWHHDGRGNLLDLLHWTDIEDDVDD